MLPPDVLSKCPSWKLPFVLVFVNLGGEGGKKVEEVVWREGASAEVARPERLFPRGDVEVAAKWVSLSHGMRKRPGGIIIVLVEFLASATA